MRVWLSLAILALGARFAPADPKWDELGRTIAVVELLIPDLRLEVSRSESGVHGTLSWPLAFYTGRLGESTGVTFVTFGEPQLRLSRNDVRGLVGERMYFYTQKPDGTLWAPLVEGGGVLGQDGHGGFAGFGIGIGDARVGFTISIVARVVATDRETRGDLALDFALPLNAPVE